MLADIGFNQRTELASPLSAHQHLDQPLRISTAHRFPPPRHRFVIHQQGLFQRFDLQPSIIELRDHELERHRFPIVGHHLQQLEPVIKVEVLLRFILVQL